MKLGVLFSGGKDSSYAAYISLKQGYEIACLISIISKNPDSYMFHTPSISMVEYQAKAMRMPLVIRETHGKKEEELMDLEKAIIKAKNEFGIHGIVTGAVESVYQSSRVQKICNKLGIECFNPFWNKNPEEHWQDILKDGFKVIITSVSCEGLGKEWLGREINKDNLTELFNLSRKYHFHPAFEGGEAETFVTDCPLFKKKLKVVSYKDSGEKNSWRREIELVSS